jgi:septum formation protein
MNSPLLILASASPRRADLLRELGFQFHVVPSAAGEIHSEELSAGEVAQLNAYRKARAVSKKFPDAVTLGVDTVVALGSTLFGKPANLAEAERMVLALLGKTHQVVTGVCLIHLRGHRQKSFCEQTDVTFRTLTLPQIRHYHALVNPLDKAGAYGIQEHSGVLVESISGSFSNVAGLPLERLQAELAAFGILQSAAP